MVSVLISVDFPQPASAVTTAKSCLSATYASLPRQSVMAFDSYSASGGTFLEKGVCIALQINDKTILLNNKRYDMVKKFKKKGTRRYG